MYHSYYTFHNKLLYRTYIFLAINYVNYTLDYNVNMSQGLKLLPFQYLCNLNPNVSLAVQNQRKKFISDGNHATGLLLYYGKNINFIVFRHHNFCKRTSSITRAWILTWVCLGLHKLAPREERRRESGFRRMLQWGLLHPVSRKNSDSGATCGFNLPWWHWLPYGLALWHDSCIPMLLPIWACPSISYQLSDLKKCPINKIPPCLNKKKMSFNHLQIKKTLCSCEPQPSYVHDW